MLVESDLNLRSLRIARENAGYTTMEATKKIISATSKRDRVQEWEEGKNFPTYKQLDKLADAYEVNVYLLSLTETMPKNREIKDYRRTIVGSSQLNEKKFINMLLQRQEFISDTMKADDYHKNELVDSISKDTKPEDAAKHIRKTLDYRYELGQGGTGNHLKHLIGLLEKKCVIVMKTFSFWPVPVADMHGVYLRDEYAPFIALNRKDSKAGQLFTLAHEIAHLFLDVEGISNIDFRNRSRDKIEILCNKIAANLLLPAEYFNKSESYGESEIKAISRKYEVSQLFVLYRLYSLKLISSRAFPALEAKIKGETAANIEKNKGSSGGNYTANMKDSNGKFYNTFILSLYLEHEISAVEAQNLLRCAIDQID